MNLYLFISISFLLFLHRYQAQHFQNQQLQEADYYNESICQEELTSMLISQDINFECIDNVIVIKDQKEVEMNLNLSNQLIITPIQIINIDKVNIKSLNILNSSVNLSKNAKTYFLNISNIRQLNIDQFIITDSNCSKFSGLIQTQDTLELTLKEAIWSGEYINQEINSISLSSSRISIESLQFMNNRGSYILIFGYDLLKIDSFIISQSNRTFLVKGEQQYLFLSNKEIVIGKLKVNIGTLFDFNLMLNFAIFRIIDQEVDESRISIDQFLYFCESAHFRGYGAITFGSQFTYALPSQTKRFLVNINTLDYKQQKSDQFLTIQLESITTVNIQQMIISRFGTLSTVHTEINLIKAINPCTLNIYQLEILGNTPIDGFIINGAYFTITIDKFEVHPGCLFSQDIFQVKNLYEITLQQVQMTKTILKGYLINMQQGYQIYIANLNLIDITFYQHSIFLIESTRYLIFKNLTFKNIFYDFEQNNLTNQGMNYFQDEEGNANQIQLYVMVINNCQEMNFDFIIADMKDTPYMSFMLSNASSTVAKIQNSLIMNGQSLTFGGCLNFINQNPYTTLSLFNTTFQSCSSKYLGGAVSGVSLLQSNSSKVINCTSYIGGGLYLFPTRNAQIEEIQNTYFENNKSFLVDDDYSLGIKDIRIESMDEINMNLNSPYRILNVQKYLFQGLTYFVRLSFKINNLWITQFNQNTFFGNIISFLVNPPDNYLQITPQEFKNISEPFFLWYTSNITFYGEKEVDFKFVNIQLDSPYTLNTSQYSIYNGCKSEGMETVQIKENNKNSFLCRYCENSKAGYSGTCETCQPDYFSECFANYTVLRQSYWRSVYSMDPSQIQPCSINPYNCIGGNGIGNSLCFDGHIGGQCLDCDINGQYWGNSYTREGFFSCTKCESITSNRIKIIILIIMLILSIFVIIITTFKRMKNQLYAYYLAKMSIFFIGRTLHQNSLTSTYIKILLFHVSIFMVSNYFTKVDILSTISSAQFMFYNPLNTSFFSLSCFLAQYKSKSTSIGYINLLFTFMVPLLLCCLIILILGTALIFKKISMTKSYYASLLSFIYIFITAFYSILLELCLQSYFCLDLDQDKSFSLIDLSLECGNSNELIKTQWLSTIILVIFLVIFPILVFIKLIQSRRRLSKIKVMFTYGFLYSEYKKKFYYWEIIRFSVKTLLVLLNVSLKQYTLVVGILLSLLLLSYYIALQKNNPFISLFLNNLEKASIIISILLLQSSIMYQQFQQQNKNTPVQIFSFVFFIIIQILNIIFLLYTLWLILTSFFESQISFMKKYLKWKCLERIMPSYQIRVNQNIKKFIKCVSYIRQNKLLTNKSEDDASLFQYEQIND